MKKNIIVTILIFLGFVSGIIFEKSENKAKLDKHYLDSLTTVKSRLFYGSAVDSRKSLEDFEDRLELYMHLDGYNGVEILQMKCKAIGNASQEKK